MSGPPYPHPSPAPGSNAIGSFVIGVSPIGTINPFDVWTTVISQYANSPILDQLVVNLAAYFDQTKNFDDFYDNIWNIDTAVGHGLDVLGRILGVSRTLTVVSTPFFGFEQQVPTVDTWGPQGLGTFFSGTSATSNFNLTDQAYRTLLFAKAFANVIDGSIPSINQLLLNLFPNRGNAYVIDSGGMALIYRFVFILSPVEAAIITQSGVIPKPVGVFSTVVQS